MDEPVAHLVHTDEAAPVESTAKPRRNGSVARRSRSSAVERRVHIADVVGSIPTATTSDPIAQMLADDAWRMRVEGRFWPKVMRALDWESCWPWKGGTKSKRDGQGYGSFKLRSYFSVGAHRVAYALYHGRSPGELLVCHTCDNPVCVNPSHLFLGTVKDNSDDMVAKGRGCVPPSVGEQNGSAKLTGVQVDVIRGLIRAGLTNVAIAARFGVTHQLISRIRRGRSWGGAVMQPPHESLRLPVPPHPRAP